MAKILKGLLILELMSLLLKAMNGLVIGLQSASPTLTLTGVGRMQCPRQSTHLRLVLGTNRQTAWIAPFIASIPSTVRERNVLGQFGTTVQIDSTSPENLFS